MHRTTRRSLAAAGVAAGTAALLGAGYVATTWLRYGRTPRARPDPLLDQFMPSYDVVEHHSIRVKAPAAVTFAAARQMDLLQSPLVRAIFRGRELLMRASPTAERGPTPLVDECIALGWGVLAEEPGREIVLGAVTKPWEANVRFQALAPDRFASFNEAGWVKIAWNIAVEELAPDASVFRTETRVIATDSLARKRFRRYWSLLSPGIIMIRRESLRLVRRAAEAQAQR